MFNISNNSLSHVLHFCSQRSQIEYIKKKDIFIIHPKLEVCNKKYNKIRKIKPINDYPLTLTTFSVAVRFQMIRPKMCGFKIVPIVFLKSAYPTTGSIYYHYYFYNKSYYFVQT